MNSIADDFAEIRILSNHEVTKVRPIISIIAVMALMIAETAVLAETNERPARAAQCLLEVQGKHYIGGDCLFTPLDKSGSFRISADKGLSAQVTLMPDKQANVSWSGQKGGEPGTVPLGSAYNNESGCWIVDPDPDPYGNRTLVCAWEKRQRLILGPTPPYQSRGLAWGERLGMSAKVLSSSELDTENAVVTAVKDRDGAIAWCRQDYDYSAKCIENTLGDTGLARGRVTLHANCKTGEFTDFWGRHLKASKGDILNLDTNEKLGNSTAAGTGVADTAFETLCPKAAQ